MNISQIEKEFEEKGAELEHDRWARWQRWLHSKCLEMTFDGKKYVYFPVELYDRWERQIETPYEKLSEEEKESDRKETRNYIPFLKEKLNELLDEAIGEERDMVSDKLKCNCDGENYCNCQFSENDGYNQKVQELKELKANFNNKECNHEWRPVISEELVKKGYGSEAAQIGQKCIKCNKEKITNFNK